jgi:uncharacterized protein YndB with AHSA1/START domain
MKGDLHFEAVYPHPPERVWQALTDSAELAQWLMPNDFQPRLGHKFQFRSRPAPGWDGVVNCQVIELDPPKRLAYTWRSSKLDTVVSFTLEPAPGGTRLHLEHKGFAGASEIMIILGNGWKKMVEEKLPGVMGSGPAAATGEAGAENTVETLILRYERGAQLLRQALAAVPAAELDRAPAPGAWSARQTALHIVDAEIVGANRLRTLAAQPGSILRSYDGEVWAQKLAYHQQPLEPALELFAALRRSTAAMLRALPPEAWSHRATHEESGEVTLASYLLSHCQHAETHAQEIAAIPPAIAAAR